MRVVDAAAGAFLPAGALRAADLDDAGAVLAAADLRAGVLAAEDLPPAALGADRGVDVLAAALRLVVLPVELLALVLADDPAEGLAAAVLADDFAVPPLAADDLRAVDFVDVLAVDDPAVDERAEADFAEADFPAVDLVPPARVPGFFAPAAAPVAFFADPRAEDVPAFEGAADFAAVLRIGDFAGGDAVFAFALRGCSWIGAGVDVRAEACLAVAAPRLEVTFSAMLRAADRSLPAARVLSAAVMGAAR